MNELSINIKNFNNSLILKSSFIIIISIIYYIQDFKIILSEAIKNDAARYILLMPLLLIYIIYRIRKVIIKTYDYYESKKRKINSYNIVIGFLLFLLAYFIKWFGSYSFYSLEIHVLSLPIFLSSIILILFDFHMFKTLLFSIIFTVFIIPPPLEYIQYYGSRLSFISSDLAYRMIKLFGISAYYDINYGTPIIIIIKNLSRFNFTIDIACSGLYSLISFIIFSIFISYISKGKLLSKAIIIIIGIPIMIGLNILRIFSIVMIGYFYNFNTAMYILHFYGGFILIFIGALIILKIGKLFNIKYLESDIECEHKFNNEFYCSICGLYTNKNLPKIKNSDLVAMSLLTILIVTLSLIQVPVFAFTEGKPEVYIQSISGNEKITTILPTIDGKNLTFVSRDIDFEQISGQDASLWYYYKSNTDNDPKLIWVGIEIAESKLNLHPWEICLISFPEKTGRDALVTQIVLEDVKVYDNPPITARFFVFEDNSGNLQTILYWYTQATFKINNSMKREWVKMSLLAYPEYSFDIDNYKEQLVKMSTSIVSYWNPIKKWSPISLSISKYSQVFILGTIILMMIYLLVYVKKIIEEKNSNKKIYLGIVNKRDKLLFHYIYKNSKSIVTDKKILDSVYKKGVENNEDLDSVNKKMSIIEQNGLITKELVNVNDDAFITYRINFPYEKKNINVGQNNLNESPAEG